MVEREKEVVSVGNLTEQVVESSEEHVAAKSETLGGDEPQLGEVNSQVKDSSAERVDAEDIGGSCNGDKSLVKESDSFADVKENLNVEGVATNNLGSKSISEADVEENARTEGTRENKKPEIENKNTEQQHDTEKAEKGHGAGENESVVKNEEENNEMDIDHEDPAQQEKDDKIDALQNEKDNLESEAVDAIQSEAVEAQNTEESTQKILESEAKDCNLDSTPKDDIGSGSIEIEAAVTCPKEQLHATKEGEEKEGPMEIDPVDENVGGNESANTSSVEQRQTEEVCPETNEENSNGAKEIEVEKQDAEELNDNVVPESVMPDDSITKEPTEPDGASEGSMVFGQGEPPDLNPLFDPNSDIVKYIDFSGALPGDSQEIKNTTMAASAENNHESHSEEPRYDDKATVVVKSITEDMEIEKQVTDSDNPCQNATESTRIEKQPDQIPETNLTKATGSVEEGSQPVRNTDLNGSVSGPGSDKSSYMEEDKVGKKVEGGQAMQVEEQVVDGGSKETGSVGKVDNREDKSDASMDDSLQENRKTISMAKVSISNNQSPKPSFKIGECIARAASQMAAIPSIMKGNNNLNNENLLPEKLLSQLQRTATAPAKGDNSSDIFSGFFSDYRNSVALELSTSEKVCGKRNRPANTAEAFEFEDMSDTYWTDRVIHEGGEEQQPENEKQTFQIVPVELKPAQTPRSRRPYKRRKFSEVNNNNCHSEEKKPAHVDENAPAELVINFAETDRIPSETNLSIMFRHFGPIRESLTEVDSEGSRARVVFKKCSDAAIAHDSAGKFSIFGSKVVNYELNYTITENFKVQPYVVSLGEEHDNPLPSF